LEIDELGVALARTCIIKNKKARNNNTLTGCHKPLGNPGTVNVPSNVNEAKVAYEDGDKYLEQQELKIIECEQGGSLLQNLGQIQRNLLTGFRGGSRTTVTTLAVSPAAAAAAAAAGRGAPASICAVALTRAQGQAQAREHEIRNVTAQSVQRVDE
jgi:hypothetical protein